MTETEKIDKALELESLQLPPHPRVVRIEWEPFEDVSGADALRLNLVMGDETDVERTDVDDIHAIKRAIMDRLAAYGVNLFPYFWFRLESEQYAE